MKNSHHSSQEFNRLHYYPHGLARDFTSANSAEEERTLEMIGSYKDLMESMKSQMGTLKAKVMGQEPKR